MAKAKPKTDIKECLTCVVYASEAENKLEAIAKMEGVTCATIMLSISLISVDVDPSYDVDEVAQEIRELLSADVPDVLDAVPLNSLLNNNALAAIIIARLS